MLFTVLDLPGDTFLCYLVIFLPCIFCSEFSSVFHLPVELSRRYVQMFHSLLRLLCGLPLAVPPFVVYWSFRESSSAPSSALTLRVGPLAACVSWSRVLGKGFHSRLHTRGGPGVSCAPKYE